MENNTEIKRYPRVMTIAGSDPSGGAGIQADIKTATSLGCYASSAITAIVVENTVGVFGIHPVGPAVVADQIRSIMEDIGADAIKIGMLPSADIMESVARQLDIFRDVRNIVADPVMVATSGDSLMHRSALQVLKDCIIPKARVLTPNLPEAETLLDCSIGNVTQMTEAAKRLAAMGPSVYLKGGHLSEGEMVDVFVNNETGETLRFAHPKIETANTHGTGCTLSSAFASFLALGQSLNEAASKAKNYITEAISSGARYSIGHGHGPVNHLFRIEAKGVWQDAPTRD